MDDEGWPTEKEPDERQRKAERARTAEDVRARQPWLRPLRVSGQRWVKAGGGWHRMPS